MNCTFNKETSLPMKQVHSQGIEQIIKHTLPLHKFIYMFQFVQCAGIFAGFTLLHVLLKSIHFTLLHVLLESTHFTLLHVLLDQHISRCYTCCWNQHISLCYTCCWIGMVPAVFCAVQFTDLCVCFLSSYHGVSRLAYPKTNLTPVCLIHHLWELGIRMINRQSTGYLRKWVR